MDVDLTLPQLIEERQRNRPVGYRLSDRELTGSCTQSLLDVGLQVDRLEVVAATDPAASQPL